MKLYSIELTPEQLMVVSNALMAYEQLSIQNPEVPMKDFGDTFLKVSDALNEYYDDNGIED